MSCNELASLPNSRVTPRKATQKEFTYSVDIPVSSTVGTYDPVTEGIAESDIGKVTANGNVLVAIELTTRTLLTLRHFSNAPVETVICYGFADKVDLQNESMPLGMRDSVDTDGPQAMYVKNLSAIDETEIHVHYGIG